MTRRMKKMITLLFALTYFFCSAQGGCGILYGNFKSSVGQSTISVTVEFDSLKVIGYGTEQQFIEHMKQKFEKKEQGGGAKWEASWNEKRTRVFAMRLKKLCYKYSDLDSSAQATYILVVRPTKLDPGFETDDGTHFAFLSGEALLVNASDPTTRLCKVLFHDVRGEGVVADYTGSIRIGDAYAIAGRSIGRLIRKSLD